MTTSERIDPDIDLSSITHPEPKEQGHSSLAMGAGLLTLAFLANTIQGALGKEAQTSIEPAQFLWLLLVTALAVLLPIELWQGGKHLQAGLHRAVLLRYAMRAVFGLGGFFLFIWAAAQGSLVNANVLLNTTPIFIPLLGAGFLGQQISARLWGAIALGFVGLLLVVQPNAALLSNPANVLTNVIGMGAGLSAAVEFLTVRSLNQIEQPAQSPFGLTLFYLLMGTGVLAPLALWQWHPLDGHTVSVIIAAAAAFLAFQLLLVWAYRWAKPHQIGVFQYSSVIFAAIIGWLWFGEVPNALAVGGMGLIILGGALAIYFERSPGNP